LSLEKLKQEILEDAEKTIKKILSNAEKEASKILAEAEKNAELIKNQRREEVVKAMREKERAVLSMAKIDGKKLLFSTQEELFEQVFKEAKNRLSKVKRDSKYLKILIDYIKDGIKELESNNIILILNKKDKAFVKKYLNKIVSEIKKDNANITLELSEESADIMGGVILQTSDGSKIYNNSFDARLNNVMDNYRNEIMNILFGEGK